MQIVHLTEKHWFIKGRKVNFTVCLIKLASLGESFFSHRRILLPMKPIVWSFSPFFGAVTRKKCSQVWILSNLCRQYIYIWQILLTQSLNSFNSIKLGRSIDFDSWFLQGHTLYGWITGIKKFYIMSYVNANHNYMSFVLL